MLSHFGTLCVTQAAAHCVRSKMYQMLVVSLSLIELTVFASVSAAQRHHATITECNKACRSAIFYCWAVHQDGPFTCSLHVWFIAVLVMLCVVVLVVIPLTCAILFFYGIFACGFSKSTKDRRPRFHRYRRQSVADQQRVVKLRTAVVSTNAPSCQPVAKTHATTRPVLDAVLPSNVHIVHETERSGTSDVSPPSEQSSDTTTTTAISGSIKDSMEETSLNPPFTYKKKQRFYDDADLI